MVTNIFHFSWFFLYFGISRYLQGRGERCLLHLNEQKNIIIGETLQNSKNIDIKFTRPYSMVEAKNKQCRKIWKSYIGKKVQPNEDTF